MAAMFDRTTLRAAAERRGDTNPNQMAATLGALGVGRMTAYRLWDGTAEPTRETATAVYDAYRVREADLLVRASATEEAAA